MFMELWKHSLGVGMVKITSQDEEDIGVGCLLLTDVLLEFIQCLAPVVTEAGGDVYCYQQNSSKFPWQVEWTALNNHQLHQW